MKNDIDRVKLARLLNDAEDANEVARAMAARANEAGAAKHFAEANVYRRPVLLEVSLEEFITWSKEDLAKAKVNLQDVRNAIEARTQAADLQRRAAAASAAAAPKMRLATRLKEYANPRGLVL